MHPRRKAAGREAKTSQRLYATAASRAKFQFPRTVTREPCATGGRQCAFGNESIRTLAPFQKICTPMHSRMNA